MRTHWTFSTCLPQLYHLVCLQQGKAACFSELWWHRQAVRGVLRAKLAPSFTKIPMQIEVKRWRRWEVVVDWLAKSNIEAADKFQAEYEWHMAGDVSLSWLGGSWVNAIQCRTVADKSRICRQCRSQEDGTNIVDKIETIKTIFFSVIDCF